MERRCIATRATAPRAELIRFVAAPDGSVAIDLAEKLPGRGAWVAAERSAVEKAVKKALFGRALGVSVSAPPDLADRVADGLAARCLSYLSLARRAGEIVTGFDAVAAALTAGRPPAVLIEAADGARHGRDRLLKIAAHLRPPPAIVGCFSGAALSLALGRENVIHAALLPGGIADSFGRETRRLAGFRPLAPEEWRKAGLAR
ncbi:MAG: RNA-binding protein [Parvularculaceae bacterium]